MRVQPFLIGNLHGGEGYYSIIKSLHLDKSLVITIPGKGSGMAALNHSDYVDKMMVILNETSKFFKLGAVDRHYSTANLETKFQKQRVNWVKSSVFPSDIASMIRQFGSLCSRLYGLSKTNKSGNPLSPILCMAGSVQLEEYTHFPLGI